MILPTQIGFIVPAATASYAGGPGDIVTFSAWWGLRKYNSAYSGNGIKVFTAGDAANADIGFLSNGNLDTGSLPGGGPWTIGTLYDQTGGGFHLTQATEARRPTLILNGLGSLPVMRFAGASTQSLHSATCPSISIPHTSSWVASRTGSPTTFNTLLASNGGASNQIGHGPAANQAFLYFGSAVGTATASDNAFHAVQAQGGGVVTDSTLYVDGAETSPLSTGAGTFSTSLDMGQTGDNSTHWFFGDICEAGVSSGAMSAGNKASINSNQHTYWGF